MGFTYTKTWLAPMEMMNFKKKFPVLFKEPAIKFKLSILIAGGLLSCFGCTGSSQKERVNNEGNDSLKIVRLLKDVYQWHNDHQNLPDYEIIVKDSFQTGIDTLALQNSIHRLEKTNFFSSGFITNYRRIGVAVNNKLKNGKYYNEINFPFQDSDPWNYFQEDRGDYWNKFRLADFSLNADSASFGWYLDSPDNAYVVKVRKEKGDWKILYLEGFDYKSIVE